MKTKNIAMILYGFIRDDARVKREARTLGSIGYTVEIICLANKEFEKGTVHNESFSINEVMEIPSEKARQNPFRLLKFWILTFIMLFQSFTGCYIHCHDLTGLPPAIMLKFFYKHLIIIYDSHELFPDAAFAKLGYKFGIFFLSLEKFCIHFVDIVVGASHIQKKIMCKRYGLERFVVNYNFPEIPEKVQETEEKQTNHNFVDNKVRIVYFGKVMPKRGYKQLIEAVKLLKDRDDFLVEIVGYGPLYEEIKEYAQLNSVCECVKFFPGIPNEFAHEFLKKRDIGIALYENTINNRFMVSNKLFDYAFAGLAVIFPKLDGSMYFLKKIEAKMIEINADVTSIAKAISELIDSPKNRARMGLIGKKQVLEKFNWKNNSKTLKKVYTRDVVSVLKDKVMEKSRNDRTEKNLLFLSLLVFSSVYFFFVFLDVFLIIFEGKKPIQEIIKGFSTFNSESTYLLSVILSGILLCIFVWLGLKDKSQKV